jgi:hypothetical protein
MSADSPVKSQKRLYHYEWRALKIGFIRTQKYFSTMHVSLCRKGMVAGNHLIRFPGFKFCLSNISERNIKIVAA